MIATSHRPSGLVLLEPFARKPVTPYLRQFDQKLTDLAIEELKQAASAACNEAGSAVQQAMSGESISAYTLAHSLCLRAISILRTIAALSGDPKYDGMANEFQNIAQSCELAQEEARNVQNDDTIREKICQSLEEAAILRDLVIPVR